MTDPDHAVAESAAEPPPPPPPRPSQRQLSQLEADEQYARQLAEQYEATAGEGYSPRTSSHGHGHSRQYYQGARSATSPVSGSGGGGIADWFSGAGGQQKRGEGLKPNEMYDNREHSFLDDDLPVIKENLRKGFIETQTKVNSWIAGLKKKLDEQFDDDDDDVQHGHGTGPGGRGGYGGARRSGEMGRRSGDYDRYDADPQVLSDDFAGMKFHPDGSEFCRPRTLISNCTTN